MAKTYRPGGIGALMDEYERSAIDLIKLLKKMDEETYVRVLDPITKDKNCRSVKTIMNHVVRACYAYANYIRKEFKEPFAQRKTDYKLDTPQSAIEGLKKALAYTEATLSNKWMMTEKEAFSHIMLSGWGQRYDVEQMLEHAIVHILRHRRQIEKLLSKSPA